MIYTSYFNKLKQLNGICYAVCGGIPQFYQKLMQQNPQKFKRYIQFSPRKQWWYSWKKGQLTNDQFIEMYYSTVLDKININDVKKQLLSHDFDVYLLCYEKSEDFCHRHIIRQWLNKNNVECKQFNDEQQQLLF